jgi:hypothetical protein
MRMSPRRADGLVILGLAAATAAVTMPLWIHPLHLPARPTDLCKDYADAAFDRLSVLQFGQFPFRSPYHSGGYPLYAYPEDISLSPRFLLVLAAGPWAGLKLDFILTMFLAASGTYLLVRRQMGYSTPAAVVTAATFAFGGFLLQRLLQGWLINCRAATFPWVLYFWWRSRDDRRYLLPCGLVMATYLLDAKYALITVLWFMALWMLLRLDRTGGGRITDCLQVGRFGILALLAVWAALAAGVKLAPLAPLMAEHFAVGGQGAGVSWRQTLAWGLLAALLVVAPILARRRGTSRFLIGGLVIVTLAAFIFLTPYDDTLAAQRRSEAVEALRGLVWFGRMERVPDAPVPVPTGLWEEGSPVGVIGLALALIAVVCRPRQTWRWTLLAALLLWIELGQAMPRNLQAGVRQLPLLNVIRKPREQFNLYLLFTLAVLAGQGAMVLAGRRTNKNRDGQDSGSSAGGPENGVGPQRKDIKGSDPILPPPGLLPGRPKSHVVPWTLAAASVLYLGVVAWPRYRSVAGTPLPPLGPWGEYRLIREDDEKGSLFPLLINRNIGLLDWGLDMNDRRVAALEAALSSPDRAAQPTDIVHFLEPRSPNRAHLIQDAFTPLEIHVAVDVQEPGTLCIAQMKDDDWCPDRGTLSAQCPTLAVRLADRGQYTVVLRYVPRLFPWGLAITGVALIGGLVFGLLLSRRRFPEA